jgi:hypothetical protein
MFSIFNIFKRKKKMEVVDINKLHEQYLNFQFQWIQTERQGEICQYKNVTLEDGITWINFSDGTRLNNALFNEYILPLPIENRSVNITDVPHSKLVKIEKVENIESKISTHPIQALLNKQKSNVQSITLDIAVNIPSKELYDILNASFEDADDQITQYILDNLNIEDVKKSIIESIKKNQYSK